MTTQFQFDCPHCATRAAGFYVAYQWPSKVHAHVANLLAVCGVCNRGMTVTSMDKHGNSHTDLTRISILYPGPIFTIIDTSPSAYHISPEFVPENVESFFRQGVENLAAERWDAAGAMFRKTLDVATKIVSPDLRNLTLFKRIEQLVENGLLTSAMGDWSHEIRIDGNDAVHDDEPESEHDARAAYKFTEAFLIYAFSLPQRVELNRAKRTPSSAEAA
jgi:hypothetical protein